MSKEMFKKEYDVLVDELTYILNSEEIVPELQNQNVVIQLLKSVKICEFLEDKLEVSQEERKSSDFLRIISNYYAINNIHIDSYYFIDETTLNDDVNYLKIFSKNILKSDYKYLTPRNTTSSSSNSAKSTTSTNKNIKLEKDNSNDDVHANDSRNEKYDYINNTPESNLMMGSGSNFFNNLFGYGSYGLNGGMGNSVEDQMAYQAANARFSYEVSSGRIFIYNSKPKAIPIIKMITGIFVILLVVVLFISAILNSSIQSIDIPRNSELYTYLNSGNSLSKWMDTLGMTSISIGNIMSSATGGGWLFTIILCLLFLWEAYIQLKPTNNDNYKYRMRIGFLLLDVIFVLIFFIYSFNSSTVANYMFNNWNAFYDTYLNYDSGHYLPIMTAVYAFTIMYVTLLCILILLPLIAWIFQPKLDSEYVNTTLQNYISEARDQISGSLRR